MEPTQDTLPGLPELPKVTAPPICLTICIDANGATSVAGNLAKAGDLEQMKRALFSIMGQLDAQHSAMLREELNGTKQSK